MCQIIIFIWSEWSSSKKEPKPSAIKFSCCLSLCEAERRSRKKGFFVFLGGRKKRDSRSCSCFHKEKAGDPPAWSLFSQPESGRSAARSAGGHWEQNPGVKKDKSGPKELLPHPRGWASGYSATPGPPCGQRFNPSVFSGTLRWLPHQRRDYVSVIGDWTSFCGLWSGKCPDLVALIPECIWEPADYPQRPQTVTKLNTCPTAEGIFPFPIIILFWASMNLS